MSTDFSLNGRRRVVITGLGLVSPLGNDVESSWQALVDGESGAAEITAFDHTDYGVHFACELKDFDPTTWIDRKRARRMGPLLVEQLTAPVRFTQAAQALVKEGVNTFVEVGPGNVLSGLVKRIDRGVKTISVSTPAAVEQLEETIGSV